MEEGSLINPKFGIRQGVQGPAGEKGFLLIAPASEALDWDVQHEISSTCRHWMPEQQAWWIASAYLATANEILTRFDPPHYSWWLKVANAVLPLSMRVKLISLGYGSSLRSGVDRV